MSGLINYVSCTVLWLAVLLKAPDLLRHRADPYLRTICAVLGLAGLCFFLGAPPSVGAINDLGGVPNLAAPLTYAAITAYCAASQVLVVYWRGGTRVHRTARRWILAYACVLVGIAVMFTLGEAPVERRTDLDTYYATTPFIAEMIVLYLVAHLTAAGVTTFSALRWARHVDGWLRVGLAVLGIGSLFNCGYSVSKLVAVAARWSGYDWSALGTTVAPAAAGLGALLTVTGVLLPLVAPRVAACYRARRTYARLAPLERALDDLLTRHCLRLPRPRPASPVTLLIWRQTSIHNALNHLDAYLDRSLYDRTLQAALDTTGDPARARAAAWATAITTAARADAHHPAATPAADRLPDQLPDLALIADALAAAPPVTPAALRVPSGTTTTGGA
ncbi:MAB_1171c family putative transporter [Streptomyces sp. NPDC006997]|uniref:MAB_1171c family putative transporter n=1 Tax=Streptomyces sp. NPDC006997 TaxID=3155356 RepID=UPI0033E6E20E